MKRRIFSVIGKRVTKKGREFLGSKPRVEVERDPPQKFRLTYYDIFGQRPSDDADPARRALNGGLPKWTRT